MSSVAPTSTIPPIRIAPAIQPGPRIIPTEVTPGHPVSTGTLDVKA